jgi:hypothetical protein
MITKREANRWLCVGAATFLLTSIGPGALGAATVRKPDLADAVQGTYFGDVISDSQGSSKSDVTVTVTRTGRNLVQITSDYSRLPEVSVHLTSAMGRILNGRGDTTFLYDRSKSPPHLDVSFHDEVSWSGERR